MVVGGGGGGWGRGDGRQSNYSKPKEWYFLSTHGKVFFFFYAVLHQVLLSPENIAMYWQIFKRVPKLCTLAKFPAPPTGNETKGVL